MAESVIILYMSHMAAHLPYMKPDTTVWPIYHYSTLIRLFGVFLQLNFQQPSYVAFSLIFTLLIQTLVRIFQSELLLLVYRYVLGKSLEDSVALLKRESYYGLW